MTSTAELWDVVTRPMREAEEMLRAQRLVITESNRQCEALRQCVRNLAAVCDAHGVPMLEVAEAMNPLTAAMAETLGALKSC